jgi:hypothetical protein
VGCYKILCDICYELDPIQCLHATDIICRVHRNDRIECVFLKKIVCCDICNTDVSGRKDAVVIYDITYKTRCVNGMPYDKYIKREIVQYMQQYDNCSYHIVVMLPCV